jgi:hypothetical protein
MKKQLPDMMKRKKNASGWMTKSAASMGRNGTTKEIVAWSWATSTKRQTKKNNRTYISSQWLPANVLMTGLANLHLLQKRLQNAKWPLPVFESPDQCIPNGLNSGSGENMICFL